MASRLGDPLRECLAEEALAEQILDNWILKDVTAKKTVTPDAKPKAVVHVCEVHGVSQYPACQALRIDRSKVRYISIRLDDAALCEAIKAVAGAPPWRPQAGARHALVPGRANTSPGTNDSIARCSRRSQRRAARSLHGRRIQPPWTSHSSRKLATGRVRNEIHD